MKIITTFILTIFIFSSSLAQTVSELYNDKNYSEVIKFETKENKLNGLELYMIGFAHFQLGDDKKSIDFYDKAIKKGYDNGTIYFYKALSFCYLNQYDKAMENIEIALNKEPTNQKFMNQKGLIYNYQEEEDKALNIFEQAIQLRNTYGEPFFWIAYIYHGKQNFKKALDLYYVALEKVPKSNSYYQTALENIGKLEYTFTKNYLKSAKAYSEAIELDKNNYELYYKLMKSYNAAKDYDNAEKIFKIVKIAFNEKKLPEEDMGIMSVMIHEFEWKGHKLTVLKSLIEPKESLDISFKVFLLNESGDAVERRFMVEKTIQVEKDGAKHLLCEKDKKTGDHITYPYGWPTDNIPLTDLEKSIKLVLDNKMKYAAKSHFVNSE